ncbi:glycosyltransferase family 39 protein [bacterium]|nr:glycosyltransferase family 39 protein [bacterium]
MTRKTIDPVPLILSLSVVVTTFLICKYVLGFITHVADETSYLFQARILASGKLWLSPPAAPEAFAVDHIITTNSKWCSVYPLGWPLLLSIGWLIGSPWIVNPIVTGIAALGVCRLGTLLYDHNTGRLACALFCVSPFVLMTGSGSMSHMAALCAATWCVAELIAAFQSQQKKHYILAGLFAGFALIARPFTTLFLLTPAFLWSLIQDRRRSLPSLIGFIPLALMGAIYNWTLFGNLIASGYLYDPTYHAVNFSVRYYLQSIPWYFFRLNDSIWHWPWPDLLIFVPLLFYKPKFKFEWLLILCSLTLLIAYCAFSWRDVVYGGPRYIFEIVGFLSVFAAQSIRVLLQRIPNRTLQIVFVVPILLLPLVRSLPFQIQHHSQIYHGQSNQFVKILEQTPVGKNALILLSRDQYTLRTFFFLNALPPSTGNRVFVRDIPEKRNQILDAYPREEVWRLTIHLEPLPGTNPYPDRWKLTVANLTPLQHPKIRNQILHTNQEQ